MGAQCSQTPCAPILPHPHTPTPSHSHTAPPMQTEAHTPESARQDPRINPRTALLAIAAIAGLAELSYAVMNISAMPVYLAYSLHFPASAVTGIGVGFLICEGVLKGPFGILGDRVGRKVLLVLGPLISVVTAILTLYVKPEQWYLFFVLRGLDGAGAAALW